MSYKKRVVIDADVGTDDAVALLFFLYEEQLGNVKIEAIICTNGNTKREHVCKNVIRILEVANRTDIPVYRGSHQQILPFKEKMNFYHGEDGFGDLVYESEPNLDLIKKDNALVALHRLITGNPNEISIVCIGPLTNLALTMRYYDDFIPNVKEIAIMGGNHIGIGNVTKAAEFNFYFDPEAASVVFQEAKCPIIVLPWECCKFSNIPMIWRYEEMGSIGGKLWQLITRAEKSVYGKVEDFPNDYIWMPCDSFLALAFLHPDKMIVKSTQQHFSVELHGTLTRGQVVLDHLNTNECNVMLIEKIDEEFFKEYLLNAAHYV